MPGASALCLYCTTLFMQRNGTNEPRGLMGVGGVEFPFTNHVSPRHGWSREVCEPMPRPPTHPPIPLTHPPTHPCTPPTSHCPSYPLVPITPCPIPPPIHPPINPSTNPTTHPPTQSLLYPNKTTNPKHIYIMPNEFTYYSSTSFQDSKLIRVIWQYPNYGIPNYS